MVRNEVEIDDSRGSIAALAFMHEYSVAKPERDVETVDMTKRLGDMSELEREALRAQLYAKIGMASDEMKELVRRARTGDRASLDACFDLLDP